MGRVIDLAATEQDHGDVSVIMAQMDHGGGRVRRGGAEKKQAAEHEERMILTGSLIRSETIPCKLAGRGARYRSYGGSMSIRTSFYGDQGE